MTHIDKAGAEECYDDGHDVNCQLELKELSDTVVDVTTPHDSLDDTREVVVCEDDIWRLLSHVRPRYALLQTDEMRSHVATRNLYNSYRSIYRKCGLNIFEINFKMYLVFATTARKANKYNTIDEMHLS